MKNGGVKEMKRIVIVLGVLIVVILAGVGIYFGFFYQEADVQPSGDPIVEAKTPAEKIEVRSAITKTSTQRRDVNVEMPAFGNLSDYSFQENINKKIADTINPYINEIAIVADESVPATTIYRYTVSYERYNNGNYVSLVVLQNYSTGGMRSNVWKDTYTVDVVNNRELQLQDVCSSPNYKEIIVAEVNKQAKDKNIELIAGNGLADIPDTQRFYIKDGKLYIYFEPASIAPYLDGEMHFEMPYEFNPTTGKFTMSMLSQ